MPFVTIKITEESGAPIEGAVVTYSDGVTLIVFNTNALGIASENITISAPITVTIEKANFKTYTHIITDDLEISLNYEETLYKQIPIIIKNTDGLELVNTQPHNPTNIFYT